MRSQQFRQTGIACTDKMLPLHAEIAQHEFREKVAVGKLNLWSTPRPKTPAVRCPPLRILRSNKYDFTDCIFTRRVFTSRVLLDEISE